MPRKPVEKEPITRLEKILMIGMLVCTFGGGLFLCCILAMAYPDEANNNPAPIKFMAFGFTPVFLIVCCIGLAKLKERPKRPPGLMAVVRVMMGLFIIAALVGYPYLYFTIKSQHEAMNQQAKMPYRHY